MKYKFISANPSQEDLFEGKSHEKIAESLSAILSEKTSVKRQIIGLEGSWGSGKSSIINILSTKLNLNTDKKYSIFNYDVWGHQEDLSNQTFLEELTLFLEEAEIFSKNEAKKKLNRLFGKTVITNAETFPEVNGYTISMLIFLFAIFKVSLFYTTVKYSHTEEGVINFTSTQPFFEFAFLLVISLVILGLTKYNKKLLSKAFCVYKGDSLKNETRNVVVEAQSRASHFRSFLKEINEKLKAKGKVLIIVFDNLDRLEEVQVNKLWSTIHTFFAEPLNEGYNNKNIWTIIPYDRYRLLPKLEDNEKKLSLEERNCLISKTIEINFTISEPVLSDWKKFFVNSIKEALPDLSERDYNDLKNIFDKAERKKTPRKMISFINDIVTLKISNCNIEIPIQYFGLFRYLRFELKSSLDILKFNFTIPEVKRVIDLFYGDLEWQKNISAIYFNVSLDKASEILIFNDCKSALLNGEPIEDFLGYPDFRFVFEKVLVDLNEDYIKNNEFYKNWEKTFKVILKIKNIDSYSHIHAIYKTYTEFCIKNRIFSKEYLECYTVLFEKTKDQSFRNVYIEEMKKNLDKDEIDVIEYIEQLDQIVAIDSSKLLSELNNRHEINSENFLRLVEKKRIEYKKYEFITNHEIISSEYEKLFNSEIKLGEIEVLKIILSYEEDIDELYSKLYIFLQRFVNSSYINNLKCFYSITLLNHWSTEKNSSHINIISSFIKERISSLFIDNVPESLKDEIATISLALNLKIENDDLYSKYFNEPKENIKNLSKIFIKYCDYKTLLKNFTEEKCLLFEEIFRVITEDQLYKKAYIEEFYSDSYSKLKNILSEDLFYKFQRDLIRWRENFENVSIENFNGNFIVDFLDFEDEFKDTLIEKFNSFNWTIALEKNFDILNIIPVCFEKYSNFLKFNLFFDNFKMYILNEKFNTSISVELWIKLYEVYEKTNPSQVKVIFNKLVKRDYIGTYFEYFKPIIFSKINLQSILSNVELIEPLFENVLIPFVDLEKIELYLNNIEIIRELLLLLEKKNYIYFKEFLEKLNNLEESEQKKEIINRLSFDIDNILNDDNEK